MTEQVVVIEPVSVAQWSEPTQTVVTVATTAVAAAPAGGGAVDSVNGQTGVVVLDASDIAFTPGGSTAATTVQDAIEEVRDEAAGATDLAWDPATSKVTSNTGTDATLTAVDGSNPGLMTVALKSKLDGIESGATADQSAAEILTAVKTVDGAGSGLDADLLDGNEAAAFATAGHNHSGVYEPAGNLATHEADTTNVHGIADTSAVETTTGAQAKADAKVSDAAYDASAWDGVTSTAPSKNAVRDALAALVTGVSSVAGNTGAVTAAQLLTALLTVDGSGSGLDADLLDGSSSAAFVQVANNLSDVTAATARTNLDVYDKANTIGLAVALG